jgi:uncharacterized oxidoreductase
MKLDGNTILITGGSSGIGFEFARAFVALKNTVIITGRDVAKLSKAQAQVPELKPIRTIAGAGVTHLKYCVLK